MKKNKKIKKGKLKINFNIQKKTLFLLSTAFLILAGFVGVYALGVIPTPVGHQISELQGCSSENQILKWTGIAWSCVADEGGVWSEGAGKIYYNDNVGIGYSFTGSYKLAVAGGLYSKEIIIGGGNSSSICDGSTAGTLQYLNDWCDKVNDKSYSILSVCKQTGDWVYHWDIIKSKYLGSCIECTPLDCIALGNPACGTYANGCGSTINCGTCPEGKCCRGGSCIDDTPLDCIALGNPECGIYANGCGSTMTCGAPCVAGYYCDGGSCKEGTEQPTPNVNGGSCFLAGTQVLMADKSLKNIEEISIGDYVLSFDEKNKEIVVSEVKELLIHTKENTNKWENGYLVLLMKDYKLKVTSNHLIYNVKKKTYVQAEELEKGDFILIFNFNKEVSPFAIEEISFVEKDLNKVYNLELRKGPHNYFADNVLVHNAKAAEVPCEYGEGCYG